MALSVPTHLAYATDQSSAGVTSKAFASVSPASDCLLIVAGTADSASNTNDAISSVTTTLSNVGTWTVIEKYTNNIGGSQNSFIAYAKVTGAPGSGTVTVSWGSNAQDAITMELLYVTGHDTTTPLVRHQEFNGTGSSASGTLSVAPSSTSEVFVLYAVANPTNSGTAGITPGSGFTELGQQYIGNTTYNFGLEIETQYRNGGTGTAIATTGPNDGWAMMAIEIAQGSASTNASAGNASGTGTAYAASVSIKPNASAATGTGAANNATAGNSIQATAGAASGTGSAFNASVSAKPNAGAASGTGAASNGTVSTSFTAPAGNAAGTGTAYNASVAPPGYFTDDFPGSSIDTTKWDVYNRLGDQVNNEVNAVIPANVRVSSGSLLIDSKFEDVVAGDTTTGAPNPRTVHYTSGQVAQHSQPILYGTIKVRAKLPAGVGLWPCIWMLGYQWQASQPYTANVAGHDWPNGGWWEIDIAEFIYDHRTQVNNALHFITPSRTGSGEKALSFDASTQFAVYKLVWTATSLTWSVDAEDGNGFVQTLQITGTAGTDIPNTPGYLIIHTAVGGNVANTPDSSTFPQTFEVDYAQVIAPGTEATAGNAAGTGAAYNASVSVKPNAAVGAGTGSAANASSSVKPTATAATGTGAAGAASPSLAPNSGNAAGTGAASNPSESVAPTAGNAAGTGSANNATATTGSNVNASAGVATGTGSAFNASVSISTRAALASAVGAAYSPGGTVAPNAGSAAGTGVASQPTTTGSNVVIGTGTLAVLGTARRASVLGSTRRLTIIGSEQ